MKDRRYYEERMLKTIDFINQYLHEQLTIDQLAQKSHFSSFHFQRIYKSLFDETPYDTILRLRLEKSVFLLKNDPTLALKDIASQCGFASYENFTRQFKSRFECTPSEFRKNKKLQNSRIYQESRANDFYSYILKSREKNLKAFSVTVEKLPAIKIAFVRAMYGADGAELVNKYQELIHWAETNNIPYQGELRRFGMSIDLVDATPASKFRYDFAIALEDFAGEESGIIEIGEIPEGNYATIHCIGQLEEVAQVWDYLYKVWLPNSNYKPKHFPAIEEFIKGPEEIGWENFDLKCRVPIEKI